jgi:phosphoribosyl 1,2-cyclic phosphodiesterase
MITCSLCSGSKGNSIFIKSEKASILIDAGISTKQLCLRLKEIGEAPENIDAIFITHEHSDHLKGVPVFAKRYKCPVFISRFVEKESLEKVKSMEFFVCGDTITFKDMQISSFQIPHDAVDPVGFVVRNNGNAIGIATDMGKPTFLIKEKIRACSTLFLEFNHDEEMLLTGDYPWHLKQRIRSNHGHLSNMDAINLLKDIDSEIIKNIFISHISEQNNSYDKIKSDILKHLSCKLKNKNFYFTFQNKASNIISTVKK